MATDVLSRALSWEHISRNDYYLLAAMLGVGYVYIFNVLGALEENDSLLQLHDSCLIGCGSPECIECMRRSRDEHYFPSKDHSHCLFTTWELTHFLFHAYIATKYNVYVSAALSVGFELWEHFARNCGSWMDIVWNAAGYCTGVGLMMAVS